MLHQVVCVIRDRHLGKALVKKRSFCSVDPTTSPAIGVNCIDLGGGGEGIRNTLDELSGLDE